MRYGFLGLVALAASPAMAMPAATFLAKADALKAKGPMALFSSDLGSLKTELNRAFAELKTERLARVAQHKPPRSCPSPKSSMTSDELIKSMHAIPAAELATMQVKDAVIRVLEQKYPCSR